MRRYERGITAWGEDLAQARNRLEWLGSSWHLLTINGYGEKVQK